MPCGDTVFCLWELKEGLNKGILQSFLDTSFGDGMLNNNINKYDKRWLHLSMRAPSTSPSTTAPLRTSCPLAGMLLVLPPLARRPHGGVACCASVLQLHRRATTSQ